MGVPSLIMHFPGASSRDLLQLHTVFQNLALTVVGVGFVFVLVYHVVLKEKPKNYHGHHHDNFGGRASINDDEEGKEEVKFSHPHIGVLDWLKEVQFYQVPSNCLSC